MKTFLISLTTLFLAKTHTTEMYQIVDADTNRLVAEVEISPQESCCTKFMRLIGLEDAENKPPIYVYGNARIKHPPQGCVKRRALRSIPTD